jgi:hypothetical protein
LIKICADDFFVIAFYSSQFKRKTVALLGYENNKSFSHGRMDAGLNS